MSNISVIMPHYNNGLDVKRAYESILRQTLLPQEIIIIDDCSLDKSILMELESAHVDSKIDLKIIYLEVNSGPSVARNVGVKVSDSKYIAFLDCDDVWHPEKLLIQYQYMIENDLGFSFHRYSAFPVTTPKEFLQNKKINVKSLAISQIICTPTVMVKRSCFENFDENLRYCEDFLCWVMSNNSKYFYMIDRVLSNGFKRQYGESGLSSNMEGMHNGFLAACYILWSKGYWGWGCYIYFIFLEYIKYPLRLFKSASLK
ncbi:glycosyltransferase family 2 protein [Acinetobacter sp.]|uniref:glycosyltransferase family 2 protein n=1 Tax=Acinetobacter sp. TaxID=472 RepID=UPI002FCC04BC